MPYNSVVEASLAYIERRLKDGAIEAALHHVRLLQCEIAQSNAKTCQWTEDEDGNWETACGDEFVFIEGGPIENHCKFCPYCGRALVESLWEESDEGCDDE